MLAPRLQCPVCHQPGFCSVMALWESLMSGASRHLQCPVCPEMLLGLDKLTLHLYSHLPDERKAPQHLAGPSSTAPRLQQDMQDSSVLGISHGNIRQERDDRREKDKEVEMNCEVWGGASSVSTAGNKKESRQKSVPREIITIPLNQERNVPAYELVLPYSASNAFYYAPNETSLAAQRNFQEKNQGTGQPITCGKCVASFHHPRYLAAHMQLLHPTLPSEASADPNSTEDQGQNLSLSCHLCSRRYKSRGSLMVHVRFAHTRKRHANESKLAALEHRSERERVSSKEANDVQPMPQARSPESLFPSLSELSEQLNSAQAQLWTLSNRSTPTEKQGESSIQYSPLQLNRPDDQLHMSRQDISQHNILEVDKPWIISSHVQMALPPSNIISYNSPSNIVALTETSTVYTTDPSSSLQPQKTIDEASFSQKESTNFSANKLSLTCLATNELQAMENNSLSAFSDLRVEDEIAAPRTPSASSTIGASADNKQWACEVCEKRFTTKYFLKKHQRLHTGERPYVCTACGKNFAFQQSYHKHLLYHSPAKPHQCSECGHAFKELSTLHNHQRIHSGEKPFVCETCGKAFRQRVSYLVHRRIHTGVMPYRCSACDKSFRYKVSQRTHKCTEQPPGNVVRQSELVQRLMLRTGASDAGDATPSPTTTPQDLSVPPSIEHTAESSNKGGVEVLETTERSNEQDSNCTLATPVASSRSNLPPLPTINEESLRQLLAIFP